VVASLAALLIMVVIVAQQEGLFQEYVEYRAIFKNVSGLKTGLSQRLPDALADQLPVGVAVEILRTGILGIGSVSPFPLGDSDLFTNLIENQAATTSRTDVNNQKKGLS